MNSSCALFSKKRRAVFLDRDGTIIEEKEYLCCIEDVLFISGAPEAICELREAGYLVIVVTNQSGVARGYYNLRDVDNVHRYIRQELARYGTSIDGFYVCPHHPQGLVEKFRLSCPCRKGNPGLLIQAAVEHGIDLSHSFMVGDKMSDIEAGSRAGCSPLLVMTGHGKIESQKMRENTIPKFLNLAEAAKYIISKTKAV